MTPSMQRTTILLALMLASGCSGGEDGTAASFRTLLATLAIAGCIGLTVGRPAVARLLLACPEALGLVMAGQMGGAGGGGEQALHASPTPRSWDRFPNIALRCGGCVSGWCAPTA